MEETRRLNLEELWHEAAREHYNDHDIDDVLLAIDDLRRIVDCTKEVLSHLSEDARNEYYRVFDALLVGKRSDNVAP